MCNYVTTGDTQSLHHRTLTLTKELNLPEKCKNSRLSQLLLILTS